MIRWNADVDAGQPADSCFGETRVRQFRYVAVALGLSVCLSANAPAAPQQKKAAPVQAMPINRWPDEQFENWYFNQVGSAKAARQRYDSQLTLQLDALDRICRLTDEQKKKLQMVGQGDIKRVFDNFERAKFRFNQLDNDVQKLNEIMQEIRPMPMQMSGGPFDESSLLFRSLRHTLNDEQRAQFETVERERQMLRHRALIAVVVGLLEQTAPLQDAQRRALVELLTAEIKPARSFSGSYGFYLLMDRIDRIPEEKMKPLLSAIQWKALQAHVAQYKGVVPNLRRSGYFIEDDDDTEATPSAPKK
jgi:hypothetical protein